MESKSNAAAQAAAGGAKPSQPGQAAKAAATTKATTVAEQAKATPAEKPAKTLEELIEERAEQVRRQSELIGYRKILISTREGLEEVTDALKDSLEADEFNTTEAKITVELGGFTSGKKLEISNPKLIVGFVERICSDINSRIAALEVRLMA
jgi:hypothetical protein